MRFEIYQDDTGKWWWRLLAENGMALADSSRSYGRREYMVRTIRAIKLACRSTMIPIEEVELPESFPDKRSDEHDGEQAGRTHPSMCRARM